MTLDLDPIKARIVHCVTYNFGLHAADVLANEDAPALVNTLERVTTILDEVQRTRHLTGELDGHALLYRLRQVL
mgnify:FL=1